MTHTPTANQWLRRFRLDITSSSNRVYANGRQQVEITVTLEPRDGETVTEQNLATLELLQVDDDGNIRVLDSELRAHDERDPRFAYHTASGVVPSPLMESSSRTIRRRFYVTSTLPGGTLSTVYAGIWKDEQSHFETDVAPFKSSVVIESIAPHHLPDSAFQLVMQDRISYKENSGNYWDDEIEHDVGYFGFKDPNNLIIESLARAVPSGETFYVANHWDHALISFELTNDYSQTTRLRAYAVGDAFELDVGAPQGRLTQRPHHMTLHRFYRRFYARHWNGHAQDPSLWTIIDRDGNEHSVEFLASNGGNAIDFRVLPNHA
ncbi:hypothetical protein [Pseudomonas sp. EMN2]|uniref:hypothetical protein n=1 Tax=Pseudomonas sp. EMN2 TaxID=2615212 RepID=UPI00129C0E1B|nr:hypothetical protein [Pseudomonas sp. EMN2]